MGHVNHQRGLPSAVVLRHDLQAGRPMEMAPPGDLGDHHFDWLILPPGATVRSEDDAVLISFRCNRSPADPLLEEIEVERMAPHRARYLFFEGDLGGGRGTVTQVARGDVLHASIGLAEGEIVLRWHRCPSDEPTQSQAEPVPDPGPHPFPDPVPDQRPTMLIARSDQGRPVRYLLHRLREERWRVTASRPASQ